MDVQPGEMTLPQSMNRYVYCMNDPINLKDINGERGGGPGIYTIARRIGMQATFARGGQSYFLSESNFMSESIPSTEDITDMITTSHIIHNNNIDKYNELGKELLSLGQEYDLALNNKEINKARTIYSEMEVIEKEMRNLQYEIDAGYKDWWEIYEMLFGKKPPIDWDALYSYLTTIGMADEGPDYWDDYLRYLAKNDLLSKTDLYAFNMMFEERRPPTCPGVRKPGQHYEYEPTPPSGGVTPI